MILGLLTFYILFSIGIGLGILRYEQESDNPKIDYLGAILYPLTWPYFLGIALSKIINNDYVLIFNHQNKDDENKTNEKEE